MRKLKLFSRVPILAFLLVFLTTVFGVGNAWGADELKATLDFTSGGWGIPSSGTNTSETSFTKDGITIKLAASTNYKQNSGYLILGKSNSTLTLPAFTWKTTKIEVDGHSGASGSVEQNIYVGSTAVSTKTTGANGVTNTYNISSDYQASGNVYIFKIVSAHNTQIDKIRIYGESGSSTPSLSVSPASWDFGEVAASASASKVFSVSGSNLETGTLTISVPSGFSVSPSSISVSEATLAATEVTVSKNTTTINDYSGNLSISGCGLAEAKTVALEMSVVADPEPTGTFALFSGDIEEGDYVIYYGGKALQASITSDRWGCLNVTPAENKITNPDASIIWHIAASDDNWTLYNAKEEKYAASTGAKNKGALIADGTDEKAIWSVSGTYDFINVARSTGSDPNNKYLRYNSQNADNSSWACYASGTGGALTLYQKQVAGKPATPAITGEISFLSSTEVTMTCATEGATIYYTTTESAKETPATSGDWTAYDSENKPSFSATTTVWAAAKKDDNWSSVAEKTFTKIVPLTTMDEIFARAKEVKSTATDVYVTFNNWTISGVTSTNAYLTDGTKGLIIYASSHGFAVNDKLSGTAACKVQLYRGSIELTSLTASTEGLTVTHDGVITPVEANIADLDTINTGAPIILKNVAFDGTNLVDADSKSILPFNTLYSDAVSSLVEGKNYNITGIYLQYNATKEVLPRSAADIEEMKYQLNYILPAQGTLSVTHNESYVGSGTKWVEGTDFTLSSTVPSDDYKAGVYTVTDWGEPANDVTADVLSGNTLTMPKYNVIVTVAFPEKAAAAISWSNSGAAVNVHIDNTAALPTLTKGEFTVTCNSSDENVATVDNDGVVTMVGAGTTTISAVFAGDDDYKAKTVSYELTVLPDFYIAGNFTSWGDNKIPVAGESKTINLAAGSYELKVVTTADEWKGFENLDAATVVSGIYTTDGGDANICFKLDAASNVTVSYVGGKISLVGNFAEQEIKVAGEAPFTWDGAVLELAENKLTASKTFTALEAKSYAVKMINGGSWLGNGGTINRENPSTVIVGNGDNMSFVADMAGDYTFTWTFATRTLTVTYPALPEKEYYVAGSFTNWETGKVKMTTTDDETWTATVALEADKTGANKYEFKIIETQLADTWLGLNSAASMVYGNCTDWTIGGGGANIGLETTKAADYTFTYVPATKKLSVNIPQKDAGLAWNASTATAYTVGKEYELPTLSNPNGLMVELSSSNEAVAYLDEGQLKIAGAGTATITATSAATGVYAAGEATYTLTVYSLKEIEITGTATKTEYEAGDAFDRSGLTATAVYKVDELTENYDITALATWNATPATIAANTTSVRVTAAWEGKDDYEDVAVTVKTHKVIFDAEKNHVLLGVKNGLENISSGDAFAKGTVLTVEVELESADYVLATLTANTTDIKATKQFTIGEVDVTIEATSELKPLAPISWSAESASIALNGDVATLPTLVNEQGLGIRYMNNNEEAATIDEASGEITLVGPGEATILAVYEATPESQYRTTLAEYTLTVTAATYAVTFEAPTNGSLEILNGEDAVASGAEFVAGTELTITATADQGYKLSSLTVNGEDFVSGETYTMGAQAVVVVATFVQDSGTALDNAEAGEKAQKIMLNNQLFILRGGKIYDAQGKLVK